MLYLYTWPCKNALEYDTFIIMSTWTNENGRLGIDQPLDGLNCRFHKLSTHSIRFNYLALLVPQWNISGTIFHGTWWSRVKSWTNSNWHDWSLHCHLHLNLKTKKNTILCLNPRNLMTITPKLIVPFTNQTWMRVNIIPAQHFTLCYQKFRIECKQNSMSAPSNHLHTHITKFSLRGH